MDINPSYVKEQRQKRSWTQQHLADACNVSLRTIQRVERLGVAAPDTVLGLCAVFEIDQSLLMTPQELDRQKAPMIDKSSLFAALLGVAIGAVATYVVMTVG